MQTLAQPTAPSPSPSLAARPTVLQQIPPSHLGEILPLILNLLEAVVARSDGEFTVPALLELFARSRWQLWVIWDGEVRAIVATELHIAPSGMKLCSVHFCTGRGAAGWAHHLAEIEGWAQAEGCQRIGTMARKGWAKHLPDYKMTHVYLKKDL